MKALIIDGEELLRLSLKEVASTAGSFTEIITAGSEHEFLAKTADQNDISLIILHPDSMTNHKEDWIKLIRRLYPGVKVLVITQNPNAGISSWMGTTTISRTAPVNDIIAAIRKALHLPTTLPCKNLTRGAGIRQTLNDEFSRFQNSIHSSEPPIDLTRLSYRQKQILAMAADGLPNKEIAARLTIAEGTVKAHMHAIFKVLGVSNRTQAVIRYGASGQQITVDPVPTPRLQPEPRVSYSY